MANLDPDSKIHRPDQYKQVKIGNTKIVGEFGPNVVVNSGNMTAINIAGGKIDGDVYQIVSENTAPSFEQLEHILDDLDLKPEERKEVIEAATNIRQEMEKGSKADEGLIRLMLTAVGSISPIALKWLVEWITSTEAATKSIRATAQSVFRTLAK